MSEYSGCIDYNALEEAYGINKNNKELEIKMRTAKYFTATWCGPCKAFKPVMNEVAGEGYSIQFVDVDQNQELASKYGVRSVPTTVIEENGVEVDRFVGALPKQQVIQRLNG